MSGLIPPRGFAPMHVLSSNAHVFNDLFAWFRLNCGFVLRSRSVVLFMTPVVSFVLSVGVLVFCVYCGTACFPFVFCQFRS